jgi:hypothetical protein
MATVFDDREAAAGDSSGHLGMHVQRRDGVGTSAHDQCRHAVAGKLPAPVETSHHGGGLPRECLGPDTCGHRDDAPAQ